MEKQMIKRLRQVQKAALESGMTGTVKISFHGSEADFDSAIKSITEFKKCGYSVEVAPDMYVSLFFAD